MSTWAKPISRNCGGPGCRRPVIPAVSFLVVASPAGRRGVGAEVAADEMAGLLASR